MDRGQMSDLTTPTGSPLAANLQTALVWYSRLRGAGWKQKLTNDWSRGCMSSDLYDSRSRKFDYRSDLLAMRSYGYDWLMGVTLPCPVCGRLPKAGLQSCSYTDCERFVAKAAKDAVKQRAAEREQRYASLTPVQRAHIELVLAGVRTLGRKVVVISKAPADWAEQITDRLGVYTSLLLLDEMSIYSACEDLKIAHREEWE